MHNIPRSDRCFYVAVGALALCVGAVGFFNPEHADWALPWSVPPLHARFLGAMYLSGVAFMAVALGSRSWNQVRVVTPMIAVWTGTLFLVSLVHLSDFDFTRQQAWVWFAAYLVYPLGAVWITWRSESRSGPRSQIGPLNQSPGSTGVPRSLRIYLRALGLVATGVALALLFVPQGMANMWPWSVTPLLTQIYGAPFLSYGLGGLYAARQASLAAVQPYLIGTLVFTLGVLLASVLHLSLFSTTRPATWLWFIGFAIVTLGLVVSLVLASRAADHRKPLLEAA